MTTLAVGDIVYPYGTPLKLGRVLEITTEHRIWHRRSFRRGQPDSQGWEVMPKRDKNTIEFTRFRVRWIGSAYGCSEVSAGLMFKKLTDLIADHEKKLAGHKERLRRAEEAL